MTTSSPSYPAQQGPNESSASSPISKGDAAILERIRKRFAYHEKRWKEIRDRGDLDMQALDPITGPWTADEIKVRDDAKRPWVHLDQLNQYSNMLINELRQNPLAIKVDAGDSVNPADPAANAKAKAAAQLSGSRIRHFEYEQNAAQAIITAFESAVQRGYGAFGLLTEDIAWDDFNQKLKIRRFADPNCVSWDPDCKEADCSDMTDAFVWKRLLIDDFERDHKNAEPCSFGSEDIAIAPDWIDAESIQIAEYWCVEKTKRTLYLVNDGSPTGRKMFKEDLPAGAKIAKGRLTLSDGRSLEILKTKTAEERKVMQYLTNGLEILDRFEWAGSWIPIFPMVGKEKYTRRDGKTERTLESYIRGGIKGQKLFNLYKTNEAEDVAKIPQNLLIGYEGQFATSTPWDYINKIPTPYAEVKATVDGTPQGTILPLPQIQQYQLRIGELSIGEESARRAIQAALGSYGFTKNDDTNVKSGKAINLIDRQSDMGSYHFLDNAKCTVKHYGRCVEELQHKIEDTPRNVGIREADGTHKVVRINEPYTEDGKPVEHRYRAADEAANLVTIGTGASYQSQREEEKAFAADLAKDPNVMGRAGDLIVKLTIPTPLGDQIAERLMPPEFRTKDGQTPIPPEAQQQLQQKEMQLQSLNAHAKQLEQQLIDLQDKAKAEEVKMAGAERQTQLKLQAEGEANRLKAELEQAKLAADIEQAQREAELAAMKIELDRAVAELKARTDLEIAEMKVQADLERSAQERAQQAVQMQATQEYDTAKTQSAQAHALELADKKATTLPKGKAKAEKPKTARSKILRDEDGNIVEVVTVEERKGETPRTSKRVAQRDANGQLVGMTTTEHAPDTIET